MLLPQRIVDNLPRYIDHVFLGSLASDLQEELIQGLSLGDSDAAETARLYLAEDSDVTIRRTELLEGKEMLDRAMTRLGECSW